jgi:hypothetical protein
MLEDRQQPCVTAKEIGYLQHQDCKKEACVAPEFQVFSLLISLSQFKKKTLIKNNKFLQLTRRIERLF